MLSTDYYFFFNDTATTEIYTLSLHDALPISRSSSASARRTLAIEVRRGLFLPLFRRNQSIARSASRSAHDHNRSEEHTSELQSRQYLVCRLLLEKKKIISIPYASLASFLTVY